MEDNVFVIICPFKALQRSNAKLTASELYTCILGNTFVEVSIVYSALNIFPQKLSGMKSGLNPRPLGYIMHIVRESDIPIMSDNANCMNSLLSALKYIYMQAATTYKNHNTYGIIKYSQKGIILSKGILMI